MPCANLTAGVIMRGRVSYGSIGPVFAALIFGACPLEEGSELGPEYFVTCGDPSCGQGFSPEPGMPLCTAAVVVGESCTSLDEECAIPDNSCNERIVCALNDPRQNAGGCPISQAAKKRDIVYVDETLRASLANAVLSMPLATYEYQDAPGDHRLGFIIDDVTAADGFSPAVLPNGRQVDVYGYASLAVAALQEQNAMLQKLSTEVEALRAEVGRLQDHPSCPVGRR